MSENAKKQMRTPIETGAPDGFQYMHPTMRKNFGQWKYHEHPRPGVLVHYANSGEEIWVIVFSPKCFVILWILQRLI